LAEMLDLRRRIRAVRNIQQVTKAMEMVAAAKLRRAQQRLQEARPYAAQLRDVLARLVATGETPRHPLFEARGVESRLYLLVTGDRGLCGSYNSNMIKKGIEMVDRSGVPAQLAVVGRRGRDVLRRRGFDLLAEFLEIGEEPRFHDAGRIARTLTGFYEEGLVDEVVVVYTRFVSALSHRPAELTLLPVRAEAARDGEDGPGSTSPDYIYEPSAAEVLGALVPRYVEVQLYRTLLEGKASEHGARMRAMGNATDNAEEMIDDLTAEYNRERQASITREISEIVRGAEALK